FDDEQQSTVELGHGLANTPTPVTELHRRTLCQALHTGGDRGEVVGAVTAEAGGVAELEAVPGQGQDMACPWGAFQEAFQQPGEGVEIHHVSFGDPVGLCPRMALRSSPKPSAAVVGPESLRVGF